MHTTQKLLPRIKCTQKQLSSITSALMAIISTYFCFILCEEYTNINCYNTYNGTGCATLIMFVDHEYGWNLFHCNPAKINFRIWYMALLSEILQQIFCYMNLCTTHNTIFYIIKLHFNKLMTRKDRRENVMQVRH